MAFSGKLSACVGLANSPLIAVRQFFAKPDFNLRTSDWLSFLADNMNRQLGQWPAHLLHSGSNAK